MSKSISLSRAVAPVAAVLGFCLLVFACPAAAFTAPRSKAPGGENTPLNLGSAPTVGSHTTSSSSGGASIVRTIVGLAIVIAVIWGLAWILRQVKSSREGGSGSQSSAGLTSVAALTLGSGRSVHLIRAGHDYLLVGSAEHGLVPIHRYTEEQARDAGLLIPELPRERSRLLSAATHIVSGQGSTSGRDVVSSHSAVSDSSSVVAGEQPDPMRMGSASFGLVERLREWTVRR
jgi:flagellar protein FliO/FliZ